MLEKQLHQWKTIFMPLLKRQRLENHGTRGNLKEWTTKQFDEAIEQLSLSWSELHTMLSVQSSKNYTTDNYTFYNVLKACRASNALQLGRKIHVHIIQSVYESYSFVGSALVDMYSKCYSLEDARDEFEKMSQRDVVLWSSMIAGFVRNGFWEEVLGIFRDMQRSCLRPNLVAVVSVLSWGSAWSYMGNALVGVYGKCNRVDITRQVFDGMPQKDAGSSSAMLTER
ncbi:hypothetical protein KI387_000624, partial [Taxus chinensis]